MSLLSSFIIDPVVRHARRFSGVARPAEAANSGDAATTITCHSSDPNSTPYETKARVSTTRDIAATPISEDKETASTPRLQRYPSFAHSAQDAVVEEACNGSSSIVAPIAIPIDSSMPHNQAHILDDELRQLNFDPSLSSAPAATTVLDRRPATISRNATTQSESLPADDGMAHLRARIHEIRDLNITDHERARMVHSLMTERYNYMRPTSPSSFVSQDRPYTPNSGHSVFSEAQPSSPVSAASDFDPENPYKLRPGDTSPTYRPHVHHSSADHGEDEEEDFSEGELALGCVHYRRNVKVQCFQCQHWYTCRHCHDAVEDHHLNRKRTENMLCMACGTPQKAADRCSNCQLESACYYCDVCKLWDNNSKKKIYHCPDCGICRRGEGLGKDFSHCKVGTPGPFKGTSLIVPRNAMFALPSRAPLRTNAIQAPWRTTALFVATTSSPPLPLLSPCPVDTTFIKTVTTYTWRLHTNVPYARRVRSAWSCNGAS